MANKTISLPDDVMPIIATLDVPFSTWVAEALRRHAATKSGLSLSEQLLADAALTDSPRPTAAQSNAAAERMDRSAPW